MSQMSTILIITPSSFNRSSLGSVSGEIYLQMGNSFFPEKHWSDLVVPVAAEWVRATANIIFGNSTWEEVFFMDGPFSVKLAIETDNSIRLDLLGPQRYPVGHTVIDAADLFRSVQRAGRAVLDECQRRGWNSTDLEKLAQQLSDARIRLRTPRRR